MQRRHSLQTLTPGIPLLVLGLVGLALLFTCGRAAQAAGHTLPDVALEPAAPGRGHLPLVLCQQPPPSTPTPTLTPTPAATVTATPSATPSPTPTTAPAAPWRYHVAGIITGRADPTGCGFSGRVWDASGAPQAGVQVRAWAEGWPAYTSGPSDAEGRWSLQVADAPTDALWHLAVVDRFGSLASPVADVPTHSDVVHGHQWYTVDWQEMAQVPEFVVASARRLACLENKGNHNLYVKVYDLQGNGLDGLWLRNAWEGGYDDRVTYTKWDPYLPPPVPQGAGYTDFVLWASVAEYTVQVRDFGSGAVRGITTRLDAAVEDPACVQAWNGWGHWSYLVVFQRSRAEAWNPWRWLLRGR